jgi:soluble lytic murein transglycosylase-like protein
MRRLRICTFGVLLTLVLPVQGQADDTDWALCRTAIAAVERETDLPPGLLGAIARAESGRRHPLSKRIEPWPWAMNVAGIGSHAASRAEAVATVAESRSRGVASIDVGCMQINLLHHPAAFSSIDEAFEPVSNVRYAAGFLHSLRQRAGGDWGLAIARYHSATPERGEAYRLRVLAQFPGSVAADASLPAQIPFGIAVFTPQALAPVRALLPPPLQPALAMRRLPQVFVPTQVAKRR